MIAAYETASLAATTSRSGAPVDRVPKRRLIDRTESRGAALLPTDALRERERVRAVDRAALAAHVGLPAVRSRFASTTGRLLAAERSADLGARGAEVHVGDAAV